MAAGCMGIRTGTVVCGCVFRPVDAVASTAGPDGFADRVPIGLPGSRSSDTRRFLDHSINRIAITFHALANIFDDMGHSLRCDQTELGEVPAGRSPASCTGAPAVLAPRCIISSDCCSTPFRRSYRSHYSTQTDNPASALPVGLQPFRPNRSTQLSVVSRE